MASLNEIFQESSHAPYAKPLRVKVVARGEVSHYTVQGDSRQCLSIALSDGNEVVRGLAFDPSKFSRFLFGKSVVLRDIIRKIEDGRKTIVITKTTKVFMTSEIEVPDAHQVEGNRILNPPPAEVKPIVEALRSPSKQKVSIRGKIVQEEDEKTVHVRGDEVPIKMITVEDASGRTKVTMWRDSINRNVRPGDFVEITNVITNTYKQETNLSTTNSSKVEKSETPLVEELIKVVGVCVEDSKAELLLDDDSVLCLPAELLCKQFPDRALESITDEGTVELQVSKKGSDVIEVVRV